MYSPKEIESIPNYNKGFKRNIVLVNKGQFYQTGGDRSESYVKIQQFTGVKDLYGKEIFEGDIVQLVFATQPCGFGRYEIIFKDAAFHLKTIEKNWLREEYQDTRLGNYHICRVIGNIFENPKLAKVK
jgi:uncharacterized phage protein (TIGR01671 family)